MSTDEHNDPIPVTLTLTPEAKKLFIQYFNAHNAEQMEMDGDLGAAWSKLEEVAARLALIIQCVESASAFGQPPATVVEADSMRRGIALTEWFKHEARRVYAMLDETETAADRRKLTEWIERRGGAATARDVCQGHRRFATTEEAEKALDELADAGDGYWSTIPTTQKGGRISRRFILSTSTKPTESS